jgi:hypothetical protein
MPLFEQSSGPEDLVDRYFFSLRRRLFFSHHDRSDLAPRDTLGSGGFLRRLLPKLIRIDQIATYKDCCFTSIEVFEDQLWK